MSETDELWKNLIRKDFGNVVVLETGARDQYRQLQELEDEKKARLKLRLRQIREQEEAEKEESKAIVLAKVPVQSRKRPHASVAKPGGLMAKLRLQHKKHSRLK
ncbi:hypothetical protein HDU91_003202 [Kappamyces sp. JEL0680]|nr:hypothetical protein HDU91_003202 [Kappamyces sp. JEL0680]